MARTVNRRVSIRDVARIAGVSIGTVSRVLNDHPNVSARSRDRVRSAIAQLEYRPSAVGRALSKRSIGAVGILVPDMTDPIFMLIAKGVEAVASRYGYAVMLANSDRVTARELMFGDVMAQFVVSGVVIVGGGHQNDHDLARRLEGIPTVVAERRALRNLFPSVTIDHYAGARRAVEHLLEMGHRRIGTVCGDQRSEAGSERYRAYRDVLKQYELGADPSLAAGGSFDMATGIESTKRLLDLTEPPTAIFYPSDDLALAGLSVMRDRGLGVPEDISVVGFNDIPFAEIANPPLTTVHMPSREIGVLAMQTLVALIEGDEPVRDVVLGLDLIIRRSTGPPPVRGEGPSLAAQPEGTKAVSL